MALNFSCSEEISRTPPSASRDSALAPSASRSCRTSSASNKHLLLCCVLHSSFYHPFMLLLCHSLHSKLVSLYLLSNHNTTVPHLTPFTQNVGVTTVEQSSAGIMLRVET